MARSHVWRLMLAAPLPSSQATNQLANPPAKATENWKSFPSVTTSTANTKKTAPARRPRTMPRIRANRTKFQMTLPDRAWLDISGAEQDSTMDSRGQKDYAKSNGSMNQQAAESLAR